MSNAQQKDLAARLRSAFWQEMQRSIEVEGWRKGLWFDAEDENIDGHLPPGIWDQLAAEAGER